MIDPPLTFQADLLVSDLYLQITLDRFFCGVLPRIYADFFLLLLSSPNP